MIETPEYKQFHTFLLAKAIGAKKFFDFTSISIVMAANKEVKVEPYSMAFVTAPNKDVAKTLAGGLGKNFFVNLKTYFLLEEKDRKIDLIVE